MKRVRLNPTRTAVRLVVVLAMSQSGQVYGQEPVVPRLEIGGVPAINFDSDEGFGYGVILEAYQYGSDDELPYRWTLQPTVFLTTEGRRDLTLFFDAPHLLRRGWRLDVFLGSERQIAAPYYGVGNDTPYDESLAADDGPDPYFYRFGRTRRSATFNLQRPVFRMPLRALFGGGIVSTTIDPFPEDVGSTLFAQDYGTGEETEWSNYVRGGLIWDTRDRESGPRRGSWTELLVRWADEGLGASSSFVRWTITDRRYFSVADRLVFANRFLLQGVTDGAPSYELFLVQTSFKQQEGLGGAKTVRGALKNRFVGQGMFVWNAEVRWRALDFGLLGRPFHAVLSAFVDQGRVWAGQPRPGELFEDLHRGVGGGVRLGMGENFVVALDVGRSDEAGAQLYLGLGYLY